MRISQLEGRRVALWGWGREGRAAHRAIRARLPSLPLTLFCNEAEARDAAALGDAALAVGDRVRAIVPVAAVHVVPEHDLAPSWLGARCEDAPPLGEG